MEKYLSIVMDIYKTLTLKTTLENDRILLEQTADTLMLSGNQRMAVVYRSERKQLVKS